MTLIAQLIFQSPLSITVVAILALVMTCVQCGFFQYALQALKNSQGIAVVAMHHSNRLVWLTRGLIVIQTTMYVGALVLPLYPVELLRNLGDQFKEESIKLSWFSLMAPAFVYLMSVTSVSRFVTTKKQHLLSCMRVGLFSDGFPWFMERWHMVFKCLVLVMMVLTVVPFAVYVAYAFSTGFARWYGYINFARTRMR